MLLTSAAALWARSRLALAPERGILLSLLVHGLFRDTAEIDCHHVDPQQRMTVDDLRIAISHFHSRGYTFLSPEAMPDTLEPDGCYVLLTFDDGYASNRLALAVLEEFGVPATFYISTRHVIEQRGFWWDILHRKTRAAAGHDNENPDLLRRQLKTLNAQEIRTELHRRFGPDCETPVSDVDRPFTPDELADFSKHPLVHLGNHTMDHALLPNHPRKSLREQIVGCQEDLERLTGRRPRSIAYPNGRLDETTLEVTRELGFDWGITTRERTHHLPLNPDIKTRLTLGRHTLWGGDHIDTQCLLMRSRLLDSHRLNRRLRKTWV